MRKLARGLLFVSLVAGCTLAGLTVWARWGPTLNPPAVDAAIRLNRDHAHVDPACVKHYGEAFAALTKRPEAARTDDGLWRTERPIAAEIVAWVEQNNECLRHIRAASTYSRCWFTLKPRTEGGLLFPELSQLRLLARLLDYRARIAADRGDLETFIESTRLMDRIARHLADHPLALWQIVACAVMMETQRLVLEPFAWPALTSAERAAYRERLSSAFLPPPPECEAMRNEIENTVWRMYQELPWHARIIYPIGRLYYEYHHALEPFVQLADRPVEAQMSGLAKLQLELDRRLNVDSSKPVERVCRLGAAIRAPSWTRTIENRACLICRQRGNAVVMAILAHEDAAESFPTALDRLDGATVIDPLTGEPFIYRLTDDGFTLYSVGLDGDDDAGVHHPDWGRQRPTFENPSPEPDGDYVFWPLPD